MAKLVKEKVISISNIKITINVVKNMGNEYYVKTLYATQYMSFKMKPQEIT